MAQERFSGTHSAIPFYTLCIGLPVWFTRNTTGTAMAATTRNAAQAIAAIVNFLPLKAEPSRVGGVTLMVGAAAATAAGSSSFRETFGDFKMTSLLKKCHGSLFREGMATARGWGRWRRRQHPSPFCWMSACAQFWRWQ